MIRWQVKADDPKVLREFLKTKNVSRRIIGRVKFHGGQFSVNGRAVHTREVLQIGDCVGMELPLEPANPDLYTSPLPLNILYEDEQYLVINKPAGLISTPSRLFKGDTAAARVKHYLMQQNARHQVVHTVTRLDRFTSGVMLFAKNMYVHSMLGQLLVANQLERSYLAVTKGHFHEKKAPSPLRLRERIRQLLSDKSILLDSMLKRVTKYWLNLMIIHWWQLSFIPGVHTKFAFTFSI